MYIDLYVPFCRHVGNDIVLYIVYHMSGTKHDVRKAITLYVELVLEKKTVIRTRSHSATVVHRTSHSDVTWKERPNLGPYKSFWTSFYVPASVQRNLYVRLRHHVDATSFLRPRQIGTSGKLSYGPKVGYPLNVRGRISE